MILSTCPKLERLILSGCGNVVPPTCPGYDCAALRLRRLRFLFFADGDDFSWDHDVPPCFWWATLAAGKQGAAHPERGSITNKRTSDLHREDRKQKL